MANWITKYFSPEKVTKLPETAIDSKTESSPQSYNYTDGYSGGWRAVNSYRFDGEKTPGELGNPINLVPDFDSLRLRSYEAELKSDVVKIITGKFFKWVVGTGLKNQPQPQEKTLATEGIENDWAEFRETVEARFSTYVESKMADYSGMENFHVRAAESFETSFLGGDCLVVFRVDNNLNPNVQVIDGQHVTNPILTNEQSAALKLSKNRIKHGVELNSKNQHVAFWVRKDTDDFSLAWDRVAAYGEKSKCLMAFMIYGKKHRIDHVRGIPIITPILEKIDKLDRYTEASVSAAEERAKIPWFIEHNQHSDGSNPMIDVVKVNRSSTPSQSSWDLAEATRKEILITQAKTVTNMPIGSKMSAIFSQAEFNYPVFFESIFMQLCASCDVPPEVALQKYSSNYSASRAAINGWGFIVGVYRKKHADKMYKNFYSFWLYCEVLKSKVKAPGYLKAKAEENHLVLEAYSNSVFLGANLPHIDPLKEVKAIRSMIGDKSKGEVPLIDLDQATEQLNNGDWREVYKKWTEQMKITGDEFEVKEKEEVMVDNSKSKKDAT
jgi:capsid protein